MPPTSDRDLIAAVIGGQIDAFATLVGRYRDVRTRYAIRMLGSYASADDALQAAFVRAFRSLAKCKEPDRFGDWLFRMIINECRSCAMRRSVRRRFTGEVDVISGESAPDSNPANEVQRALDALDPIIREPFILQYVEELSYPEIAALTGANVPALEMRVDRACARLRELLGRMYAEHRQSLSKAEADAHDPGVPFVTRIAEPLRRPEVLNDTFEDRLMAKLLKPGDATDAAPPADAEPDPATSAAALLVTPEPASAAAEPWGRGLPRSPQVMAGAATAVVAVAFSTGYLIGAGRRTPEPVPVPSTEVVASVPVAVARTDTVRIVRNDTVHVVRFLFVDPTARSVALVGDFNGWNKKATALARGTGKGAWSASVPMGPGRHEYAYLVDGKRWILDPLAAVKRDEFGTETSVVAALPGSTGHTDDMPSFTARLGKVLPTPVAERLRTRIAGAPERSLAAVLESRALKFAAKGVPAADIERAISEQSEHMERAWDVLKTARGSEPSAGEVEVAAEALRLGAESAAIAALAKSASPSRALDAPLRTLVAQMAASAAKRPSEKGRALAATKRPSSPDVRQAGAPAKSNPAAKPVTTSAKKPATTPAKKPAGTSPQKPSGATPRP